jgi:hypothetical protein
LGDSDQSDNVDDDVGGDNDANLMGDQTSKGGV